MLWIQSISRAQTALTVNDVQSRRRLYSTPGGLKLPTFFGKHNSKVYLTYNIYLYNCLQCERTNF